MLNRPPQWHRLWARLRARLRARLSARLRSRAWVCARATALLVAAGGCSSPKDESRVPIDLIDRFSAGRLGDFTRYAACAPIESSGGDVSCRARDAGEGAVLSASARLAAQSNDSSDAARRQRALLDLRWSASDPAALERPILVLRQLATTSPSDGTLWNAIGVAELQRGDLSSDFAAYLRALDAVSRSLRLDSTAAAVHFNRALILQRLHLTHSARAAWERVLARNDSANWKEEARAHLATLVHTSRLPDWSTRLTATSQSFDGAEVDSLVGTSIQSAREFGFQLLGAWGRAVDDDREEDARYLLLLCARIGAAIAARGGDAGLQRSATHLQQAHDRVSTLRLARAYMQLAEGVKLHATGAFDDAAPVLRRSSDALQRGGAPMWKWASFYRASTAMNVGRFEEAISLFRALELVDDAQPALRGKALWAEGVTELRRGNYEQATRLYDAARPDIARSGESENIGALSYLRTESLRLAGRQTQAMDEARLGMQLLSSYPTSPYLNNHETNVASLAREAGLPFAALEVSSEVILTSEGVRRPQVTAWALRTRARDHLALGDTAAATSDLERALRESESINPGAGRDRVRADVAYVLSDVLRDSHPDSALQALEGVVAAYRRLKLPNHLPGALARVARWTLARGDTIRAIDRLIDASRMIAQQTSRIASPDGRAAFVDAVDPVFDQLIQLRVARGESDAALRAVLQAQARPWIGADGETSAQLRGNPTPRATRRALDADERLLNYAVLDDRVCIWVASNHRWSFVQVSLSRDSLAKLVSRATRYATQRMQGDARVEDELYDLLVRPVAEQVAHARRLVIVADRELGELAFASLRDGGRNEYLIQQFELRHVPSAAFIVNRRAPRRADTRALVIGDVRYERSELTPLPGAAVEASAVASLYPEAIHLAQEAAVRDRVLAEIGRVSIVHFAGHAVTNRVRPELSYLALSTVGDSAISRLDAREILNLRLSNVRVAVLSACSTQGAATRRGGMMPALAYSFLTAGASATVSTLWEVNDQAAVQLQRAFHRRLVAGERVAEALRHAQLSLLLSGDAALAHPGAWAGFVVNGR